MNKERQKEA